jgi:hypothetical protein
MGYTELVAESYKQRIQALSKVGKFQFVVTLDCPQTAKIISVCVEVLWSNFELNNLPRVKTVNSPILPACKTVKKKKKFLLQPHDR